LAFSLCPIRPYLSTTTTTTTTTTTIPTTTTTSARPTAKLYIFSTLNLTQ